jgi:predicted CoA-binding protein
VVIFREAEEFFMKERVAVLGASDRPERYAHMANRMLKENGHETLLVSPKLKTIEGEPYTLR